MKTVSEHVWEADRKHPWLMFRARLDMAWELRRWRTFRRAFTTLARALVYR
jgi:hypothetical protein